MEKMIDLKDLLKHELIDLYSAEEQIIDALPAMIEKARNADLKKALNEHLKITREQKKRLDEVKQILSDGSEENQSDSETGEKKGFFSRLFKGSENIQKCKGMEGLITEGQKVMGEDMSPEVLDAAIIGCAQRIEHYEIAGYGTARAYSRELNLGNITNLLEKTLNEEYEADDRLTKLAVGRLNIEAEEVDARVMPERTATLKKSSPAPKASSGGKSSNGNNKKIAPKKAAAKKSSTSPAKKTGGSSNSVSKKATSRNRSSSVNKKSSKAVTSKKSASSGKKNNSKK